MLDQNGYKRKTYTDLLEEMQQSARERFGENIRTDERSVMGILLRIMAWFLSLLWKDNEDVYYSAYPRTASGVQLDRIAPYAGITRSLATYAYGQIQITGTEGYIVPTGFLLSTESDIFFETIEPITLTGGTGTGQIRSIELGRVGNVATGTVTEIINPDADVISVTNPEPVTGGREKETDFELRERFSRSIDGLGSGTAAAIRKNVTEVTGVRAATVIENFTDTTDEYGTPSRSFQTYVLGGSDDAIGQAILASKAAGIQPYGSVSVDVPDLSGNLQTIGFTRAVEVEIYANLSVTKNNAYPSDGDSQLKNVLINYIGGEDADGVFYSGLNMGEDVILSRLYAAVYSIPGVEDVQIELSTDDVTYTSANVQIDPQEVAQTSFSQIGVTHNV